MLRSISDGDTAADRDRLEHVLFMMIEKTTAVVAISVAVLALAALGRVFLAFAAHTATSRRVNASAVDISRRLKKLKQTDPP